ncbi:MAG: heavy-metal-associated domain-containing protein [Bacteroidetes bacterium]|nr:heavy-metal-associated domain-containing protein [Bacteroidota bacterium]
MKSIIILCIGLIFSIKIHAQSTIQTTTIAVKGNCDECKERIENAADIKGVKTSHWDEVKQAITVTYDSKKVTAEQIETAIAKSGHKTTHQAADVKAYNGLPSCCKYEAADCKKKK